MPDLTDLFARYAVWQDTRKRIYQEIEWGLGDITPQQAWEAIEQANRLADELHQLADTIKHDAQATHDAAYNWLCE